VADYAGLIQPNDLNRIGAAQKMAYEELGTPIIVVTIPSMRAYQFNGTIEQFAAKVFNSWRIGTKDKNGANRGILLLVSVGDRKARIELGADWGQQYNSHTNQIMNGRIIPQFKRGNYSGGIADGVEALRDMAMRGPAVPGAIAANEQPIGTRRFTETVRDTVTQGIPGISDRAAPGQSSPASPIPKQGAIIMMIVGVVLMIASVMMPEGLQKPVFWLGLILVLLPLVAFVIFFAIAALMGRGGRRGGGGGGYSSGWSGGGYSSSGGFSGGFSGGGGSTGSW
jgi:uncharacterized membrane protein YgcG